MKQLLNLSQPLRSLYCLWYDTITNDCAGAVKVSRSVSGP